MASAYEIIQGISQAAADCYDGAYDDKGEPVKIGGKGLKRELGHPVLDTRLIDGFKVKIGADRLYVTYQTDVQLKDVHAKDFESNMESVVEDVAKYIKKSYKKLTGESLSLSDPSEVSVLVQSTSRVRVFAISTKSYKIGGMDGVATMDTEDKERKKFESDFNSFLEKGGWGKRPKNDDRKKQ